MAARAQALTGTEDDATLQRMYDDACARDDAAAADALEAQISARESVRQRQAAKARGVSARQAADARKKHQQQRAETYAALVAGDATVRDRAAAEERAFNAWLDAVRETNTAVHKQRTHAHAMHVALPPSDGRRSAFLAYTDVLASERARGIVLAHGLHRGNINFAAVQAGYLTRHSAFNEQSFVALLPRVPALPAETE